MIVVLIVVLVTTMVVAPATAISLCYAIWRSGWLYYGRRMAIAVLASLLATIVSWVTAVVLAMRASMSYEANVVKPLLVIATVIIFGETGHAVYRAIEALTDSENEKPVSFAKLVDLSAKRR